MSGLWAKKTARYHWTDCSGGNGLDSAGNRLSWFRFSWFFSTSPGECRERISFRPTNLPSKSFLIHRSTHHSMLYIVSIMKAQSVERLGYRLVDRGVAVRFPTEARDSLFAIRSKLDIWPTQPRIQWVLGAVSSEINRQCLEADHSCPSCAEVRKDGAIHPLFHTFQLRDS
jgi:hypothetical protein